MKNIVYAAILLVMIALVGSSCEVFQKLPPHPAPPGLKAPPRPGS